MSDPVENATLVGAIASNTVEETDPANRVVVSLEGTSPEHKNKVLEFFKKVATEAGHEIDVILDEEHKFVIWVKEEV